MQRCPNCHWQIPDNAVKCSYCGQSLHPDSDADEERRRCILRLHMFNTMRRKSRPSFPAVIGALLVKPFTVVMVVVIMLGIMVGPALKLIPPFAPSLAIIDTIVPGGSVIVHGTNFPPGSSINLTLDGASTDSGSITVGSDGTFDANVSIPGSWQPNSEHVIEAQAIGQGGRSLAQAQQIVTIGVAQTPTPGGGGQTR